MKTCSFVDGEKVNRFERAFAAHTGVRNCVACSSGTAALHLSLLGMRVGFGDEVIVPVNTFIATAEAVSYCGATPVFVDILNGDYCIDPAKIEPAITSKTKAIISVHLHGQPAEMDTILAVVRRHGLKVLEDCAQAHNAVYKGRKVGTFSESATFSFYLTKNLGAYGEGGAVLTNDDEMAYQIRALRKHGATRKYGHDSIGYNYRMDGFQGAVLGTKLKYLQEWTAKRRHVAAKYRQALAPLPVVLPSPKPYVRHIYHLFVIRTRNRDAVIEALNQRDVATGIHYPVPIHLTGAYAYLGYSRGAFPEAEMAADELISLPMFPELTDEMIEYVGRCVKEILEVNNTKSRALDSIL